MSLRRLSLLIIAVLLLTPDASRVRSSQSPEGHQAAAVARSSIVPSSGPRTSSLSPFSSWRYRLKSVLQESDNRLIHEADLGPVPMPEPSCSSDAQTPRFDPSRTIVPLRC
jgi:hypothetical protein